MIGIGEIGDTIHITIHRGVSVRASIRGLKQIEKLKSCGPYYTG